MGLDGSFRKLLLMNAMAFIIFIYIGIFVNLYIWEQGHKIADVAWFNLMVFVAWGISFTTGARLLKQYSIRLLFGLSALSGGLAFILLSYLQLDSRLLWISVIAIPVGAMWGFFYCAQNLSVTTSGKGSDFGSFFAASNTISQIMNMSVPLLSAQVIFWFGYSGSFTLMLLFVTAMLITAAVLPKLSLRDLVDASHKPQGKSAMAMSQVFTRPALRWIIPSCLVAGLFLQFQAIFVLLFTFSITEDKMYIALLNTLYTVSSLVALLLYRKIRLQEQSWLMAAILLLSGGFLLMLYPVPVVLIISNVCTTMGMFYFGTVWNAQHFRVISGLAPEHQSRMLVWREGFICGARGLMLLLILPITNFSGVAFVLLIALATLCLFSIPFFQKKLLEEPADVSKPPVSEGLEAP